MNRDEKNRQTRQKIIDSATLEFGKKSYGEASLNTVCSSGNISKGIIYHYFADKDELYLACIKECFKKITDFLQKEDYDFTDFESGTNKYLAARNRFFRENPEYGHIFFTTILHPPLGLASKIKECRKEFDTQCIGFYKEALGHIPLRENVTEDEAMEYFFIFQEMFNGYFQREAYENTDLGLLAEDHEAKLAKILNMMIYGISKERK